MTSNVYTLYELVDLALRTPSVGSVNFNILRIILQNIISECKLQNVTAEWTPFSATPVTEILEDEDLPDHPILRQIDEKKKKESLQLDKEKESLQLVKEKESLQLDKKSTIKITKSATEEAAPTETVQKTKEEDTRDETTDTLGTSTETEEISDESPSKHEKIPKKVVKKKKKKNTDVDSSSKGLKVGSELWQLWQIKKLTKTVEALVEELSELVEVVDDLKEFKKTKFEEGDKYQSGYTGSVITRNEFEDAIDSLGEALVRVTIRQNQQKDDYIGANEDTLKEVSQKVSWDDLAKSYEPINKKLKTLSVAVRNIQKVMKDVIYPETCGTTKCMACNRKAQLPHSSFAMDGRQKDTDGKRTDTSKEDRYKKKKDPEGHSALKFTNICLQRARFEESQLQRDGKSSQDMLLDQQERHPDRSVYPDYFVSVEPFSDLSSISRDFAPLRRNTVYVPTIYQHQAPATISVEGDNTQIFLQRCTNPVK